MTSDARDDRWAMLPGARWENPLQARTWLIEQRRLLGWTHKQIANAFLDCAYKSDLYIGTGGGALFDRPTEKRIARFEQEGAAIPDWMYWMPLVIQHAQIPLEDRWTWEREHVPAHADVRREREDVEDHAGLYQLDDDEIALIERFRAMSGDERGFLRLMAQPEMLGWLISVLKRAHDHETTLLDMVESGLARLDES
ncbi:MAG: hypothetical protein J0I47_06190 [Sphingomonas sp.]|uniref:hypothetical protein n=1 Tax=Sphingomonas sp. TaxID=28214 RepID=UPI001AC1DAF7|nr:hypothetical protein [Sphingomonas sp.]MBN8807809.1 hypothetical protein [Sphingomonas sp.]